MSSENGTKEGSPRALGILSSLRRKRRKRRPRKSSLSKIQVQQSLYWSCHHAVLAGLLSATCTIPESAFPQNSVMPFDRSPVSTNQSEEIGTGLEIGVRFGCISERRRREDSDRNA